MSIEKIVITGGPSTGKTAIVLELERRGFFCVHELVRDMTSSEKKTGNSDNFETNPILSVKDPENFNRMLLAGRIEQFRSVDTALNPIKENKVFFDRGIPDVHAYMRCFGQEYDSEFERHAREFRYDRILLLPPWREIYTTDSERFESYEESERIFAALRETYRDFGYDLTLVPKGSIAERTECILNLTNAT